MVGAIPRWRTVRNRADGAGRWAGTTPGRLRMLTVAIAVASIGLAVIGSGALIAAYVTAIGIQQRTVPAILGMESLHSWLADADRSAANAYLAGGSEVTLSQQQYEADIAAASRELQIASEHNPSGGDTSQRLQAIATSVDQYAGLIQSASVLDRKLDPNGNVYLKAGSSLMHRPGDGILAQIDALRAIYATGLDQANSTQRVLAGVLAGYIVVALIVLGLLAHTQRFLRIRFRRQRNHRLLAATLLVLLVSAGAASGAVQAAQSIRTAQDQSYSRLLNLGSARALVYDANGNESLSLISNGNGATFDQAFLAETKALVDRPLTDQMLLDAQHGRIQFNGLLADELRNASSPDERAAAMQVLQAFKRFMDTDTLVRTKVQQGDRATATALTLGTDQGQLTFAFEDVDWYLGVNTQILQSRFDQTMATAEGILAAAAGLNVLAVAIALLAFWGLKPRIDEYMGGKRPQ